MSPELVILLPPSEGKAPGGSGAPWTTDAGRFGDELGSERTRVVNALKRVRGGTQKVLGASGDTLARARAANLALVGAPTMPAWQRFTGVVWEHLDVASLAPVDQERALRSVLVVTALTGVSALNDPVPDFRLKLSVSLPRLGKLSTRWQPTISGLLEDHLRGCLVIDLLPNEHAAAWVPSPSCVHRRVTFAGHDGKVIGHTAKAAKGLLARALVQSDDPERALATWTHPDVRITS